MHQNLTLAQRALAAAVERLDESADCACHHALENAIMTDPNRISADTRERLRPIAGRLLS
jgi:hypothetical protein